MKHHHLHVVEALRLSGPREIARAVSEVSGFNNKVAVAVTRGLGSMWCAWAFCTVALLAAPAAFGLGLFPLVVGLAVVWVSQCFIQLVALSVLQVGANAAQVAADDRAAKTYDDAEAIKQAVLIAVDRLDTETAGGLKTVLDRLDKLAVPAPQ